MGFLDYFQENKLKSIENELLHLKEKNKMLKKFESSRTFSCDKDKGFSETKKMLKSDKKSKKILLLN